MSATLQKIPRPSPAAEFPARLSFDWAAAWPVAGIVAVGGLLRFWDIDAKSLWGDEAMSHWFATGGFGGGLSGDGGAEPGGGLAQVWARTVDYDFHTPFYYGLLHLWMQFFGESESAMRSLSALAGTITVLAVYPIARLMLARPLALLAMAWFALSPFQLIYSADARMYAILAMFGALAILGAGKIYFSPPEALAPRRLAAWAALYAVGAAGALWSHNLGFLLIACLNLLLFGRGLVSFRAYRGVLAVWVLAQLAVLAAWLPWLRQLAAQTGDIAVNFWNQSADVTDAITTFAILFAPLSTGFALADYLLAAGALLGGLWALRAAPAALAFLAGLSLLPFVAEWAMGQVLPVFLFRTLIWTQIAFAIALAAGIGALARWRWAQLAVVAVVLAGNLAYFRLLSPQLGENWRAVAAHLEAEAKPDDLILSVFSWQQLPLNYYLQRNAPGASRLAQASVQPAFPVPRTQLEFKLRAEHVDQLPSLIADFRRAHIVLGPGATADPLLAAALQRLGQAQSRADFRPGALGVVTVEGPAPEKGVSP